MKATSYAEERERKLKVQQTMRLQLQSQVNFQEAQKAAAKNHEVSYKEQQQASFVAWKEEEATQKRHDQERMARYKAQLEAQREEERSRKEATKRAYKGLDSAHCDTQSSSSRRAPVQLQETVKMGTLGVMVGYTPVARNNE